MLLGKRLIEVFFSNLYIVCMTIPRCALLQKQNQTTVKEVNQGSERLRSVLILQCLSIFLVSNSDFFSSKCLIVCVCIYFVIYRLGDGEKAIKNLPIEVKLPTPNVKGGNAHIVGVACGSRHSFVWTDAGQAFSFGNNFYAQLGYDFQTAAFKEHQVTQLRPVLPVLLHSGLNVKGLDQTKICILACLYTKLYGHLVSQQLHTTKYTR